MSILKLACHSILCLYPENDEKYLNSQKNNVFERMDVTGYFLLNLIWPIGPMKHF